MPGTEDNQDDDDTNRLLTPVKSLWSRFWARVFRGWWTR